MKPKNLIKTTAWLFIAVVTLSWYTCNPPSLDVEQPQLAEKYSSFEATVWVTGHGNKENREPTDIMSKIGIELPQELLTAGFPKDDRENILYFGIKMPLGWEVTDSIPFDGVATGIFVYSDSLSAKMDSIDAPEPGYSWWVSETPEPIIPSSGTIEYFPEINTDGQSGNFYIDYMLGYNSGLNNRRNNDHYIGVGLADTAWVTSSDESGPGSIRAAIDSVRAGGHVYFAVPLPDTILLTEQIVIYKDISIHGPDDMQLTVSGNNVCPVMLINNNIEADISNIQVINGNTEDGYGGGIYCGQGTSVSFNKLLIKNNHAELGGGIYFSGNEVYMEDVSICSNSADANGGGIYFNTNEASMAGVTISSNIANNNGGGIYFSSQGNIQFDATNRCDIYQNSAYLGWDLYNANSQVIDVVVDTFTVAWPNDYFAYPYHQFSFDILNHAVDQYQQDLYVNPNGSDTNSGLTPIEPKKTITNALAFIVGTEDDLQTIYLAPGIYCDSSTGERFPLYCRSYVSFSGFTSDSVILSGEDQYRVFEIINSDQMVLKNMTIQNTYNSAIYCQNSSPTISNITIRNCESGNAIRINDCQDVILTDVQCYNNDAAGVSLNNSTAFISNADINNNLEGVSLSNSEATLSNCHIYGNSLSGGLSLFQQSVANLSNCRFWENTSDEGGAIRCYDESTLELSDCLIKENNAENYGGGIYLESSMVSFNENLRSDIYLNEAPLGSDLYSESSPITNVVVDTFTVLFPNNYFASPMPAFTFDILHAIHPQWNQDIYVNPSGSDGNTGLTPKDPLLSITKAMKIICTPGGPHTIHLAPGTYSASLTGEQFPIICQDSISIYGTPDSITILDGEANKRILHIEGVSNFTLSNFNLYNGLGGIYARDAVFTLENVLIHHNDATAGGGIYMESSDIEMLGVSIERNNGTSGGGLFITGTSRLITDSLFISYNTASRGGGIFLDNASISLQNIVFNNNTGDNSGGGIYCYQSDVVFENMVLETNRSEYGGGMAFVDCDPFLENVLFQNNNASIAGGGLWLDASSPFLHNVQILNNKTQNGKGGGIHLQEDSDALFTDVEFRNNEASDGGGLYCDGSQPTLIQCSFYQNKSDIGGGLYLNNFSNPYIYNSIICTNEAESGGGIFNTNKSNPYLSESNITYNESVYGGGIYFMDSATVTFDPDNRCNIFFNSAYNNGADLYAESCEIIPVIVDTFTVLYPTDAFAYHVDSFDFDIWNYKLELGEFDFYVSPQGSDSNTGISPEDPLLTIRTAISSTIADTVPPFIIHLAPGTYSESTTGENYPLNCRRNNVWLMGDDSASTILDGESIQVLDILGSEGFLLSDLSIINGWSSENGGGIYCEDANISIGRVGISNCYGYRGGGIYIKGKSVVTFQDVHIFNNGSKYGGGLYCRGESVITGNNVLISGNFANSFGGGIYCSAYDGKLTNLTICNNTANLKGGGIYCASSSPLIYNTVVSGNMAAKGGGIYTHHSSHPKLINLSVSGNIASSGGAIYTYNSSNPSIINSILWNNIPHELYGSGTFNITYSDIQGSWEGEGNIDEDPLFIETGDFPFTLSDESPCINFGTPDTTGLFLPPLDMAGNPRIWDDRVDMGAYEWNSLGVEEFGLGSLESGIRNYPNPFSTSTTIAYELQQASTVQITIYNHLGKQLEVIQQMQSAGKQQVVWNGEGLPDGIYYYRLQVGEQIVNGKMVKVK